MGVPRFIGCTPSMPHRVRNKVCGLGVPTLPAYPSAALLTFAGPIFLSFVRRHTCATQSRSVSGPAPPPKATRRYWYADWVCRLGISTATLNKSGANIYMRTSAAECVFTQPPNKCSDPNVLTKRRALAATPFNGLGKHFQWEENANVKAATRSHFVSGPAPPPKDTRRYWYAD